MATKQQIVCPVRQDYACSKQFANNVHRSVKGQLIVILPVPHALEQDRNSAVRAQMVSPSMLITRAVQRRLLLSLLIMQALYC